MSSYATAARIASTSSSNVGARGSRWGAFSTATRYAWAWSRSGLCSGMIAAAYGVLPMNRVTPCRLGRSTPPTTAFLASIGATTRMQAATRAAAWRRSFRNTSSPPASGSTGSTTVRFRMARPSATPASAAWPPAARSNEQPGKERKEGRRQGGLAGCGRVTDEKGIGGERDGGRPREAALRRELLGQEEDPDRACRGHGHLKHLHGEREIARDRAGHPEKERIERLEPGDRHATRRERAAVQEARGQVPVLACVGRL